MPQCVVPNCPNRPDRAIVPGRTFHRLPHRNPALLKVWLAQMGRQSWTPVVRAAICSDHFEESCFDRTGQTTRLRENAVPTLFSLPQAPQTALLLAPQPVLQLAPQPVLQFAPQPDVIPASQMFLGQSKTERAVIKFSFKKLRSGKVVDTSAPENRAGSSHDHDYVIKDSSLHQEKATSKSKRQLPDTDDQAGPARDWRCYDQDRFLHEDPNEVNNERHPADMDSEGESDGTGKEEDAVLHQAEPTVNSDSAPPETDKEETDSQIKILPDEHGYIKDGFFHSVKPLPGCDSNDALRRKERNRIKRIVKLRQHDHNYSIGEDVVVLKHKVDAACVKMAEMRSKLRTQQQKNRRLSAKIKALTKDAEELRERKFVINNTLRFLESLQYKPVAVE